MLEVEVPAGVTEIALEHRPRVAEHLGVLISVIAAALLLVVGAKQIGTAGDRQ
jgi:hypothetical protein